MAPGIQRPVSAKAHKLIERGLETLVITRGCSNRPRRSIFFFIIYLFISYKRFTYFSLAKKLTDATASFCIMLLATALLWIKRLYLGNHLILPLQDVVPFGTFVTFETVVTKRLYS